MFFAWKIPPINQQPCCNRRWTGRVCFKQDTRDFNWLNSSKLTIHGWPSGYFGKGNQKSLGPNNFESSCQPTSYFPDALFPSKLQSIFLNHTSTSTLLSNLSCCHKTTCAQCTTNKSRHIRLSRGLDKQGNTTCYPHMYSTTIYCVHISL